MPCKTTEHQLVGMSQTGLYLCQHFMCRQIDTMCSAVLMMTSIAMLLIRLIRSLLDASCPSAIIDKPKYRIQ